MYTLFAYDADDYNEEEDGAIVMASVMIIMVMMAMLMMTTITMEARMRMTGIVVVSHSYMTYC